MLHRYFIFLIAMVSLLFFGCAQKTEQVNGDLVTSEAIEEVDLNCSYFYFLWGRYEELHLRFPEALQAYEKALICDQDEEYIKKKIPVLLLRMGRVEEAATWLDDYLNIYPDATDMRMVAAQAALKQDNIDRAVLEYSECIARDKNKLKAYFLLGELYISTKQYQQAETIFKQALNLGKQQFQLHLSLAKTFQLQKQYSQAIYHYEEALAHHWSEEVLLEIGKLQNRSGKVDDAIETFEKILADDETNTSAMIELVNTLQLKKDYQQAIRYLEQLRVFSEYPQRVDLTIARLLAKQKKLQEAVALVENLVSKEPIPEARFLLARLYVAEEKYAQALNQLGLIEGEKKYSADVLLLQIQIFQWTREPEKAITLVENALLDPEGKSPDLYGVLGALYEGDQQQDKAEEAYLEGIDIYPADAGLRYEYGIFKENNGKRDEAVAIMQQVIELDPEHAGALNFVGYTWADANINLDQALSYIKRAIRISPDNGYIQDSLGWVYFRMGEYDKALSALEKAIELSPNDAAIHDHLGDVYMELGLVQEALASYEKALKLSEENKKLQEQIQKKINVIKKSG